MQYKESLSQIALLKWFKLQYPQYEDLLVGYPSGTYLGLQAAVRMKAMGLRAGMPDLQLLVPKMVRRTMKPHPEAEPLESINFIPGLFVEMKSETGKLSAIQRSFHEKLRVHNYTIVTCYSCEEAQEEIRSYLKDARSEYKI